jgi:hypothetical protein
VTFTDELLLHRRLGNDPSLELGERLALTRDGLDGASLRTDTFVNLFVGKGGLSFHRSPALLGLPAGETSKVSDKTVTSMPLLKRTLLEI